MTHKELVEIAYRWLLKSGKCGLAFKELKSIDDEIPDAIGFDSMCSILIEVKCSRSDFFADKKKRHRSKGMGNWRFFLCPKGMIKVSELPEKWGLIYVDEQGKARIEYDCRIKKIPWMDSSRLTTADENYFDADRIAERRIMYSALRRLFIKGYVKHIYDKQYDFSTNPKVLIELNQSQP